MNYIGTEMWELLLRVPESGADCLCHEPRVFGHQIGCRPSRSNTYGPGQTPLARLSNNGAQTISKAKGMGKTKEVSQSNYPG